MSRIAHFAEEYARVTRLAVGGVLVTAAIAAATPITASATEQISFVYEEIVWSTINARGKLEADFRRVVAARGLKVSPAEIAGAAQAAFDTGVSHMDDWETQTTMVIRGCGPAKELCFVITCKGCSRR